MLPAPRGAANIPVDAEADRVHSPRSLSKPSARRVSGPRSAARLGMASSQTRAPRWPRASQPTQRYEKEFRDENDPPGLARSQLLRPEARADAERGRGDRRARDRADRAERRRRVRAG